jgi:hypothetical protein
MLTAGNLLRIFRPQPLAALQSTSNHSWKASGNFEMHPSAVDRPTQSMVTNFQLHPNSSHFNR